MRPSSILRLQTDWTAWQVDEACALIGMQIEAAAARGEKPDFGSRSSAGGKYRSVRHLVKRRMKIPESGVW